MKWHHSIWAKTHFSIESAPWKTIRFSSSIVSRWVNPIVLGLKSQISESWKMILTIQYILLLNYIETMKNVTCQLCTLDGQWTEAECQTSKYPSWMKSQLWKTMLFSSLCIVLCSVNRNVFYFIFFNILEYNSNPGKEFQLPRVIDSNPRAGSSWPMRSCLKLKK